MDTEKTARLDGRALDALRTIRMEADFAPAAKGSVLVRMGNTAILCAVSVQESVPRWMQQQKVPGGWITAEYSMLPYSTSDRTSRESSLGKVGGRTQEIQRLIGRSIRAVSDMKALGARTLWIDCDVLQADGGTRTAAITGAYVAVQRAIHRLMAEGLLEQNPIREAVAAISVGLVGGHPMLDLCYEEDVAADVDMNVVMTGSNRFVEVQGTAEGQPFTQEELDGMLRLADKGIRELMTAQDEAIRAAR